MKVKFNGGNGQDGRGNCRHPIDFSKGIIHSRRVKGEAYAAVVLLVLTMMPLPGSDNDFFPSAVQGWILTEAGEDYTPESLYRYIDGASELYISYGFTRLISRRYEKPGHGEIVVDFFDMKSPANAFGIFSHSQERPLKEIGQDSEYLDGLLRFWKDRFYVSLWCSPETAESRTAVMELGHRLAALIQSQGSRPDILGLLPAPGLLPSTIRFFHHHAWQNAYTFISAENLLDIGPDRQAVLAKYVLGEDRLIMLLILYPDANAAEQAFANLTHRFNLPVERGAAVRLADGKHFAARLQGEMLAAVWNSRSAEGALELLSALQAETLPFEK
ncbi:MAG: hypothetical protein JXI33_04150 [Candidatus Aminicenantes bacterium]|nr:hypothetical protein [Candidatus Aminicenantes bacterium]